MADGISQKIDNYAKTHLSELRKTEDGRYKLTKYDVAKYMLSKGQLSSADFAAWMNTREGFDSQTLSVQQKNALKIGSIFSFDNPLTPQKEESYLDSLDSTFYREPITGIAFNKTTRKKQVSAKPSSEIKREAEIRQNVIDNLLNNAKQAQAMLAQYHNSIGYISSDAFVQGTNVIGNLLWDSWSGRNDFVTVFENENAIAYEIKSLESLKKKVNKPMEFEREFQKLYGIKFDANKFEKLADATAKLNEMNAYEALSNYFTYGIEKLKSADTDTSALEPAILLEPLFGNIMKSREFVENIRTECKDDTEFRNKLISILQESKKEADTKLSGFNRELLENDVKKAYKSAMGEYKSDEIIASYINSSRFNAMISETGFMLAGSLLAMGSKTVLNLSSKVISKFGLNAGTQITKAGMTVAMGSAPAVETVVGGLTSRDGLTLEKGDEAWEELKNGLMYGVFGAYVSGPLGNVVSKALSKNPQIFKEIISSAKFSTGAGTAVETTADVLFDRLTSDLTFKESMAQNGIMNFGMMFIGGRIHNKTQLPDFDLSQVKIEKMPDGTFNLKANDRVFMRAKNENELAVITLALGAKNEAKNAGNNTESTKSPMFGDLQYSKKSIRELVKNDPNLKNNQWVQEHIEELLDKCNANLYYDLNDRINSAVGKVRTKFEHPLLTQHRLKVLNTFLSNPILYENKSLQENLSYIIDSVDNAQISDRIVKSLEQYANYPKKNKMIDLIAPMLILNSDVSLDNKQKFYDYLATNDIEPPSSGRISSYARVSNEGFNIMMETLTEKGDFAACEAMVELFSTSIFDKKTIKARIEMHEFIVKNSDKISTKDVCDILRLIDDKNIDFAKKYYKNPELEHSFVDIVPLVKDYNKELAETLIRDKDFPNDQIVSVLFPLHNQRSVDYAKELYKNKEIPRDLLGAIAGNMYKFNEGFARTLINDKNFPKDKISTLLSVYNQESKYLVDIMYNDKIISAGDMCDIARPINTINHKVIEEVYNKLKSDKNFPKEYIATVLKSIDMDHPDISKDYALKLCKEYKQMEIPPDKLGFLIQNSTRISPKDLQKLNRVMGKDKVAKLSDSDLLIACQMIDIYGKTSINEISMEGKQNLLRKLVACNGGLFNVSDNMKKAFPLIPTDQDTYCSLLPAIVKSLGVDIRTIEPPSRIKEFNTNLESLSTTLAKLADNDFASLEIKLDYPKDEFITNVLAKVKDLDPQERQKVYDYFGFELHHNKNNPTGFSITGYPINLNNGKKLAEITNPNTRAVVESLRPDVIKFSEQNPIRCNNPEMQKLLNDIVDVLPEIRTQIGKVQHKTHNYDVFQHSLKVMQKVAQDPKFQALNDSDKKIMMLASLLHDITKGEGYADKTHAAQGGFDTFFIAKKFNLSREEEIKLYTLTRHHEWLEYVNTAKSEEDLTKRLQSVAYDLQHDNLFDMALMFTHADLRAVKADDSFHDTKIGSKRVDFNGKVRSFGESADVYAERIKKYISELQKSQPLLPVTKIPAADRINSAITTVNPDGSTNIKGVYKRSDGLVVIKFNEVEDWETIGFPKGSVSRGYTAKGGSSLHGKTFTEDVNTGNIKFFAHGLDYENQLAKFDAFSLIDSDVLLSVSYAERPESKYRFFRSQGVLLDFDTKYIHGGGETDSGSGCGKFIDEFKKNYIFGGVRESDRLYVSDLIKKATGMNDSEYVKFVETNKNKSLTEIEPAEYREPLIKAYASINSNTRNGSRAYNEMYGSNPKEVMAVFAYEMNDRRMVGNPLDFLAGDANQRTKFLQRYALERNIPFIVFGD